MPHDIKGRLIEVGDTIRTKPYNTDTHRFHVGPVVSMNDNGGTTEPMQSCTGQFRFVPEGKEVNEHTTDYFGADESLLLLKANGVLPEGESQEKVEDTVL